LDLKDNRHLYQAIEELDKHRVLARLQIRMHDIVPHIFSYLLVLVSIGYLIVHSEFSIFTIRLHL